MTIRELPERHRLGKTPSDAELAYLIGLGCFQLIYATQAEQ